MSNYTKSSDITYHFRNFHNIKAAVVNKAIFCLNEAGILYVQIKGLSVKYTVCKFSTLSDQQKLFAVDIISSLSQIQFEATAAIQRGFGPAAYSAKSKSELAVVAEGISS